jgi:hypothetical protein
MNKEFMAKIIKAKKLEYEALKDIMPDKLRARVDKFEKEAVDVLKDVAVEIMKDNQGHEAETVKKETKKVKVDFS